MGRTREPRGGRLRFDPASIDSVTTRRVLTWLEANGLRDWVAIEPIVVKGKTIYYTSLGRRDDAHPGRRVVVRDDEVVTRVRRLRVRIRWPGVGRAV